MSIAYLTTSRRVAQVSRGLALAFLAGPWTREGLRERGEEACDCDVPWLGRLVGRVMKRFEVRPLGREPELIDFLSGSNPLRDDVRRGLRIIRWFAVEAEMVPVEGPPATFAVLPLAGPAELGNRIGLSPGELAWFSDERGINPKTSREQLLHYRYRWVPKARGGYRLLEAPKERLKMIQRWLLDHVLAPIPVASNAHGFVPGRNVQSFVAPHVGQAVVVRMDLEDFFASIGRGRIIALFRRVGYPHAMAATLAGLCTAATPHHVLRQHPTDGDLQQRFVANQRLRQPHLPQGAPTSPALSNLAAWRLDRRLHELAGSYGAMMTRYADDLAFAGDSAFQRALRFFVPRVGAIALEEGFRINHRKTRIMSRGGRQQLCGLVVNDRPNLPRDELDNLRALLHNAALSGPDSQNREQHPHFRAHLEGRIAWVASVNPARGARLRALFQRISWAAEKTGRTEGAEG